jgi:hypothetical protein
MASFLEKKVLTFYAGSTGIVNGCAIKAGADKSHVLIAALATDKIIGLAGNDAAATGDKVEVCFPGGGGKALLGGTVAFGDYLTSNSSGQLITTTSSGDHVIAQAMDAGSSGDLCAVMVLNFIL